MNTVATIQKKNHFACLGLIGLFFIFQKTQAQSTANPYVNTIQVPDGGYRVTATVIDGKDTVPYIWLNWIYVIDKMSPRAYKKWLEWNRMRYNVKKVYPYAILAAAKLKEIDVEMAKIPSEKARKKYLKQQEKELQKQFGTELKELTITQGKILMKLIDRETGKTTFSIVKEMRGGFNAFMWQSLAVLVGSSMKYEYNIKDPYDQQIELAVRQIEAGQF
ncbi:MAG: DUF4294 domain-containing protein [Bacteroidetes bacterium]|nr:DUF4294 domain-containing protein [Bacteroidota bacterium]